MNDNTALKQMILDLISDSDKKLSQSAIESLLSSQCATKRKTVRKALIELISEQELEYTYVFGTSYVEKSFNRPVRISSSIIVKPYNHTFNPTDSDIVINIFPGVSFGSGEHPTTRLCVQGIEYAVREKKLIRDFSHSTVFDIGTGSGILAIAALKFGIETGIGTDTDLCSISEAKKNAQINDLENRLQTLTPSEQTDGIYSLITANLRFPDIMRLFPVISKSAEPGTPVVLSGIRPDEVNAVIYRYTQKTFKCLRTSEEKKWSCLVLQKH